MDKKIGIYLPYRHCEPAYMGLQLADFLLEQGYAPQLLSAKGEQTQTRIHGDWDRRVSSRKKTPLHEWCRDVDCLIWFSFSARDVIAAKLLSQKRGILVCCWHQLPYAHRVIDAIEKVVFPCRDAFYLLQNQLAGYSASGQAPDSLLLPWDTGLRPLPVPYRRSFNPRRIQLYVPAGADAINRSIASILYVLSRLSERHPRLRLMLATFKSLPREALQTAEELRQAGKLQWRRRPSYREHLKLLYNADFVWSPSLRSEAGGFALQAEQAGKPVVAYDISPVHEFLRDGVNAKLVECELAAQGSKPSPRAVPNTFAVLRRIEELVDSPESIYGLGDDSQKEDDPNRGIRQSHFHSLWIDLLGRDPSGTQNSGSS